MRRKLLISSFLCLFILIFVAAEAVPADELPMVTGIEVKGLRRIEEGAVKAKLLQKLGQPLSQEKTTEDIKLIYKMGYFDDVKVSLEPFEGGIKVIYNVKEKPTIIKVDFQGNNEYKNDTLKEKVSITAGAIADITLINENAIKLKAYYEEEGYYLAKVVPVVNKTDENEVVVTYQITEGDKVKIKEIRIENNHALPASKIKSIMKTKERGMLSFILGGGFYTKSDIAISLEQIKELYHDNGYLAVSVGEPKIQLIDNQKWMIISIAVSEGDQYKVSGVEITGNKVYDKNTLSKLVKLKEGQIFNRAVLRSDISALSDKYSNTGYAMVSVTPDIPLDKAKKLTKVTYKISEGEKYKMGKIEISGNTKTKDKVVRREIRVDEGATFNNSAVKRSHERLMNLDFFETVDMRPKPRPSEKVVDLDVKVKEKQTGTFTIGGGWGSDGPIAMAEVAQRNLLGAGQYLSLSGQLGTKVRDAAIKFRDPWFLDKELMFGATIYKNIKYYPLFKRDATGFEVSLGKRFWEYYSATVAYNLENAKMYDIDSAASIIVKDAAGTRLTSSVSTIFARDTRNNFMDPSSGQRHVLTATFAGLGGDNKFVRVVGDTGWYFPVMWDSTVHLRGRAGVITGIFGERVPLYERFYLGGIDTLRGFAVGMPGPKDPATGQGIGGTSELILNAEYIFPIWKELKVKGIVFYDAGKAYDSSETFGADLRSTAGAGVRWYSPMGPIRVEYGINLFRRDGEGFGRVEIGFGSAF
jgi:outer membrane protein insertion porin family